MADTLQDQQFALSRHLRDPSHPPPPGIEERRLAIYRDLFFNNIESLLAGNFPVIRQTLGDDAWRRLVRSFYARHRSQTPLFPEIAREFIRFLETRTGDGDPPWLRELAHYEWVELALQISEARPEDIAFDPDGDLLAGRPVVSPLAWPLAYAWPVHRIGPDFRPDTAPDTPTLLMLRREADGTVSFHALTPLAFRLLQRLEEAPDLSGHQQLVALAAEAGAPDIEAFVADGAALLANMRAEGTIPGTRSDPPGQG